MLLYATSNILNDEFNNTVNHYRESGNIDFDELNRGVDRLIRVSEVCDELIKDKGEMSDKEYYDKFCVCVYVDPNSFDEDDYDSILWNADIDPSTVDMSKLDKKEFLEEDGTYHKSYIEYVRSRVSVKALKEILKKHLSDINSELLGIELVSILSDDKGASEVYKKFKEEYKTKGYSKRVERIRKELQ